MKEIISITFFIFSVQFLAGAQTSAMSVADSLYAVGNYAEAISQLEGISSKSETVHLKMAKAHEARGHIDEALRNYRIVLQRNPDRILAAVAYAKLLSKAGQLTIADSIFKDLTHRYPENANFHYQLGLIREKQRDSTANSLFIITTALDPTHQQASFKVAKDHLACRQFVQAEKTCQRGLEANPANPSLLSILAQSYYHQKLYEKCIRQFEKLIGLGQGSDFVHTKTAFAYFQLRQYDKAIEHYNHALDHEEGNASTHYSLGKLYAVVGDYEASEGHLLTAILLKRQPIDAEFLSLGLTYKLDSKLKQALKYFNRALEENPNNERALYERAIAADNYFEDLETRQNYYQAYLNKFGDSGNRSLVFLAKRRIKDIREEMHLSGGGE